ncbi:MAG: hypothetical protein M3Y20_07930 [Actinomycetota bacterium]|nr:hypothetical protein [Actinomycetota bacterium]
MSTSHRFRTIVTLALGALAFAVVVPATAAPNDAAPSAVRAAAVKSAKFKKKVIGKGTARSCTYAKLAKAVRSGGDISFDCGPDPVTIVVKKTLVTCNTHNCEDAWKGGKRVSRVRINGGGKVTLSGGGERGIFYANTCDHKLGWIDGHCDTQTTPHVVFRNIAFRDGNATQGPAGYDGVTGGGGGGAIAMRGGRLTVKNATFTKNRCMARHSDAGGGAIRVTGQRKTARIYDSTFTRNRCASGGAVSSLGAPMRIKGATFKKNRATGTGASSGQGGNGGAIYFDGTHQNVRVESSRIQKNHAPEGGPGIFYVSNDRSGSLTITGSRITKNTGASFWTGKTKSIFFLGKKFSRSGSKIS